jgi:hypothetical protein
MAKKVTKKELLENNNENIVKEIEIEDIKTDINEIEKSLDNVDMTINSKSEENIKKIEEEIVQDLQNINEINEKIKELDINTNEFNEKLKTLNPQETEKLIKEEISKVQTIKKEIEKINKIPVNSSSMTNWWNGMGYDF